ncbi:F-box/LRR-repeat protein At5g63520 [Henckelia pumila]|uniref:F-box/LRR-repeat protein At5g63520 n=1 Tax=Henckelia pumila TaxID=405737 RepID=UPI003C6E6FEB
MENQSIRSLKKMVKMKEKTRSSKVGGEDNVTEISDLGEDLLQKILSRLPAVTFASAACVSRSWTAVCNRILSFPKLTSAISFNRCLEDAIDEVVNKVFSEPIRPHFALASFAPYLHFVPAQKMMKKKLSRKIPLIFTLSEGSIGRNVLTDELIEVQWGSHEEFEDFGDESPSEELVNIGLLLTIGFLPGIKTDIIPLPLNHQSPTLHIEDFVMDIRRYSSAVSGSSSPAAIMLFVDRGENINPVLHLMEYAFPTDTVIVGNSDCHILHKCPSRHPFTLREQFFYCAAVALVFAKDKNKPADVGETQFDVILSSGISPIGTPYKAVSVKCGETSTMLTAKRLTHHEHLDGEAILAQIYDELGDRILDPVLYIGVTKKRKCSIGKEKVRWLQFLEFHEVKGGDEEYLVVYSGDIKTRDPFRFYVSNSKAALSSCNKVTDALRHLKQDRDKRKIFGGILFTCCGRNESFFGRTGIDSSPFLENFPGVTFAGTYCSGEIARGKLSMYDKDDEGGASVRSCLHVYSAAYLVMSYTPAPQC